MWNLIFYYPKSNKYGLRALLFSLEKNNFLRKIKVYFAYSISHLEEIILSTSSKKNYLFFFLLYPEGKNKRNCFLFKRN